MRGLLAAHHQSGFRAAYSTVTSLLPHIISLDLEQHIDHQSGFRAAYSTVTSLLESTNEWCINIDNGLLNGVIFVDLKKAFDAIDHKILLQKLRCYGVDDSALLWFSSYLTDRKQKCFVNGKLSKSNSISYGVPQGSTIGHCCFSSISMTCLTA